MIISIQKYSINLIYRPLIIADTLSRAYLPEQPDNSMSFQFEVNAISALPISHYKLEQLQMTTQSDLRSSATINATNSGRLAGS